MSTYRASVRIDGDQLVTARPLLAPDGIRSLVDDAAYLLTDTDRGVLAVDLVFKTIEDSPTPIGDAVVGTSSTPLSPPPVDEVRLPAEDDA